MPVEMRIGLGSLASGLASDMARLMTENDRLRALALKFLNEQTDENAAALRDALAEPISPRVPG